MTIRKFIGGFIALSCIAGLFSWTVIDLGWWAALLTWVGALAFSGVLMLGIYLLLD